MMPGFDEAVNAIKKHQELQAAQVAERAMHDRLTEEAAYEHVQEIIDTGKRIAGLTKDKLRPDLLLHHEVAISGFRAWWSGKRTEPRGPTVPAWRLAVPVRGDFNWARGEASSPGRPGLALGLDEHFYVYSSTYEGIDIISASLVEADDFARHMGFSGSARQPHELISNNAREVERNLALFVVEKGIQ